MQSCIITMSYKEARIIGDFAGSYGIPMESFLLRTALEEIEETREAEEAYREFLKDPGTYTMKEVMEEFGLRGPSPQKDFYDSRPVHRPMKELKDYVTEIPDFPKPGILFRDVTTIISDPDGLKLAIDGLVDMMQGLDFDLVVGSESRGFVFGTPVAYAMHKGFILVRKKGKLPRETISEKYDLEYGTAELEMHADAIRPGQRVVIIDDLVATGGTTEAIVKLVEREGGVVVKIGFVMELAGLKGREKLKGYDVDSLIIYEGAR